MRIEKSFSYFQIILVILLISIINLVDLPFYVLSFFFSIIFLVGGIFLLQKSLVTFYLFLVVYFPAFSIPLANFLGYELISMNETMIQTDVVLKKIIYSGILSSIIMFIFINIKFGKTGGVRLFEFNPDIVFKILVYLLALIVIACMYLIEPSFSNIFTSTYEKVISERFSKSLNILATVGMLFFVLLLTMSSNSKKKHIRYIFYITIVVVVVWLVMHSRRTELIGVILVYYTYSQNNKLSRSAIINLSFLMVALIVIGEIRSMSSFNEINNLNSLPSFDKAANAIFALPGGASNVLVSLFSATDFLNNGGKFDLISSILGNLFPTFFLSFLDIAAEPHFEDVVFYNYDYNGGMYIPIFFIFIFGSFGYIVMGFIIGLLPIFLDRLISGRFYLFQVLSLFILSLSVKFLWYNPISIIKPIIYLFPLFSIFYILNVKIR